MDSSPAIDSIPLVRELKQREIYRPRTREVERRPLPTLVRKMLLLCNGSRPVGEVFELAGVDDDKGRAVVDKLVRMGMLQRSDGRSERPRSGFSSQEEAFFASKVAPIDECDEPFETLTSRMRKALGKLRGR
jgi:hypothetical protein